MTYDEMIEQAKACKERKKPSNEEHAIQVECVRWFRYRYQKLARLLFAIPNGGRRDKKTGKTLKEEGCSAGVADLQLCVPNKFYHGLFIEMKTAKGVQQESQKEFQRAVEEQGYRYAVCRSSEEFMKVVESYLCLI